MNRSLSLQKDEHVGPTCKENWWKNLHSWPWLTLVCFPDFHVLRSWKQNFPIEGSVLRSLREDFQSGKNIVGFIEISWFLSSWRNEFSYSRNLDSLNGSLFNKGKQRKYPKDRMDWAAPKKRAVLESLYKDFKKGLWVFIHEVCGTFLG